MPIIMDEYVARVYLQRAIRHLLQRIRADQNIYIFTNLEGDLDAIDLIAIRLRNI